MDLVTIHVNKRFLLIVAAVLLAGSGVHYYGKYEYKRGLADMANYVQSMMSQGQPSAKESFEPGVGSVPFK